MAENETQGGYVRKVREDTRRYIQELLAENKRLQEAVSSLDLEKSRAAEHFERQLAVLRDEIKFHKSEEDRLRNHLATTEQQNRTFLEQYEDVEEQNSNLANLYVASYRLHGTLSRQQVLDVIQEIVINLIGSEEMAIFEAADHGSTMRLVASFGIDPEPYRVIQPGSGGGIISRTAESGTLYVNGGGQAGGSGNVENMIACIPLVLDGKVMGLIAIFGLLPQKPGLQSVDLELFDLLATHAATALYCTGLHARLGQQAPALL